MYHTTLRPLRLQSCGTIIKQIYFNIWQGMSTVTIDRQHESEWNYLDIQVPD